MYIHDERAIKKVHEGTAITAYPETAFGIFIALVLSKISRPD